MEKFLLSGRVGCPYQLVLAYTRHPWFETNHNSGDLELREEKKKNTFGIL